VLAVRRSCTYAFHLKTVFKQTKQVVRVMHVLARVNVLVARLDYGRKGMVHREEIAMPRGACRIDEVMTGAVTRVAEVALW
jgi:hypothetical protein